MQCIADNAKKLVGLPFVHQGRNPSVGVDCIGVWVVALRMSGLLVDDFLGYQRYPCGKSLHARMSAQFDRSPVSQAAPGDALAIVVPRHNKARHLGVYVGGGMMVHADGSFGCVRKDRVRWRNVDAVYKVRR